MKIILSFQNFFIQVVSPKKVIRLVLFCSTGLMLFAANSGAQGTIVAKNIQNTPSPLDQKLSIKIKNKTLQNALDQIAVEANVSFSYDAKSITAVTQVNFSGKNKSLRSILEDLLRPYGLSFTLVGKNIIISRKTSSASILPQPTAKGAGAFYAFGHVLNELGNPIANATVSVKGGVATLTNAQGQFNLPAPENALLSVTHIGYVSQEINMGTAQQRKMLDIILVPSMSVLDEVLIIPYGTSSKRLLTGNITKITAEEIEKQPVTNLLQALQGRVAGLVINQQNGVPGGNFTVQIRGQNSILNGNTPLYIIDGIPYSSDKMNQLPSGFTGNTLSANTEPGSAAGPGGLSPLNNINPADLESIEVLKDADATAIYGSRGANGVILITTKRGKSGPMRLNANVNSGMSRITRAPNYMNTAQYLEMREEAFRNAKAVPSPFDSDLNGTWDRNKYTNWAEKLVGNASYLSNAQLSVSGGTLQTQYQIGGDYSYQNPPYGGDFSDQRGSFRFNISNSAMENRLRMTLSATYGVDHNTLPGLDLASTINLAPNTPDLIAPDGSLIWPLFGDNPYASLLRTYSAVTKNLLSNFQLSYQLSPALQLKSTMGYTNTIMNEVRNNPVSSFNPINTASASQGNSNLGTNTSNTWIFEPQADYKKRLLGGELSVLLGATWQGNLNEGQVINAAFSSDAFINNISAAISKTISNTYRQYRYSAVFSRVGFNIENKYLLNLTGRRDGSSRFGPDKRFANFGAVGAGWVFSEERLIKKHRSFLSFGKLRGSFGITGNDQLGDYKYLDSYTTPGTFAYQGVPGLVPSRLFNREYSWETNKKLEFGLELGFLKDRIFLSSSWYRNRSSNQLVQNPLAPTTGNATVQANLPAKIQNTGWEWQLTSVNIRKGNFSWTTSANLSWSKNKLVAFPGLEQSSYASFYLVGQPVSILKLFKSAGVNPETGVYQFISNSGATTSSPAYGTDQTIVFTPDPQYYGSIQNSLSYKGLKLDVFLLFVKQKGKNLLTGLSVTPGASMNLPVEFLDRWQKPGDVKAIQQVYTGFGPPAFSYGYVIMSDQAYQDASYLRIKNVALSYDLGIRMRRSMHVNAARVYLQAQNLLTFTNYVGADPESQGVVLPPLKTFIAGVSFTF